MVVIYKRCVKRMCLSTWTSIPLTKHTFFFNKPLLAGFCTSITITTLYTLPLQHFTITTLYHYKAFNTLPLHDAGVARPAAERVAEAADFDHDGEIEWYFTIILDYTT